MVGCTVENELKEAWKEVVVARFGGIFCHFLGGTEVNQSHQDNWHSG
jgi:hypothetical protein